MTKVTITLSLNIYFILLYIYQLFNVCCFQALVGQAVSPLSPSSIPACSAHDSAPAHLPSCPPQHILSTSSYSCLYLSHLQPPISDILQYSHHHSSSPHDQTISVCFSLIHLIH